MNRQTQLQTLERKMEAYRMVIQATVHQPTTLEALREYCLLAKRYNEIKESYDK